MANLGKHLKAFLEKDKCYGEGLISCKIAQR